eukprot:gb/GECG01012996.1/.p1 GENE.gb/GECG01012996.1/~~gb/GECG01012996.1/.p1  ORF type:complete len:192 (+),score=36.12 gb/GECG01012996.1/:1-576(+)
MVVGAPVALLAYSRRARDFVKANKQGFYNLFMGTMACLMCLRNIKYQYNISTLQKKLDEKDGEIQYLYDSLCSEQGTRWIMEQLLSRNKEEDVKYVFQSLFKAAQTEAKLRHQTKIEKGNSTKATEGSSEEEDQLMEALGEGMRQGGQASQSNLQSSSSTHTVNDTRDSQAAAKSEKTDEKKSLNNYKGWL